MSDRPKQLNTVIDFAATTGSIAASQYMLNWFTSLQQDRNLYDWIPIIFVVITFAIAKTIFKYLLKLLLESSRFLRKWIFFQDQYVEGLWFDIIRKNEEINSIGHSTISYSDGKYQVSGEDFSVDGESIFQSSSSSQVSPEVRGHFHFESTVSDWPMLKYIFIYNGGTRGYGEAEFINNNIVAKYNGYFVHLATGERFTYESFLVKGCEIKSIGLINKDSILKYLKEKMLIPKDFGSCDKEEKEKLATGDMRLKSTLDNI
jgi:hypothetical protein